MTESIEQERIRLQNDIDAFGMAVWSAFEIWPQIWSKVMKEIEAHHQIDKDHRFSLIELEKADDAIGNHFDNERRWATQVQEIEQEQAI
jgi:hypothetical protein